MYILLPARILVGIKHFIEKIFSQPKHKIKVNNVCGTCNKVIWLLWEYKDNQINIYTIVSIVYSQYSVSVRIT